MAERLGNGEIGIVQLDILPDQADGHGPVGGSAALNHGLPLTKLGGPGPKTQLAADDQGEIVGFEHERRLVQVGKRSVLDDAVRPDIAEHGDLAEDLGLQRLVAAQDDDVRRDAHALQLFHGVLGRLGLMLIAAGQEGNQGHVDKDGVPAALFETDLTGGLEKGLALDVAGGAADLGDHDIGVRLFAHAVDKVLDLLRDMRNDLDRLAQVLTAALLVQDIPVDLAGGQVGEAVQVLIDEALVMAEVEIGLAAVLGHIDLAVLVGAHGAGVNIDVGVQLLGRHLQAAAFEQAAQRGRGNALSETGDHAAGHKNEFRQERRLLYQTPLAP